MRYDESTGRLNITVEEMARIAKRGISSAYATKADPRVNGTISKSMREILPFEPKPENVVFGFEAKGELFELVCCADSIEENRITLVRSIPDGYDHPTKQLIEMCRAEGFLTGHSLCSLSEYDCIKLTIVYINEKKLSYEKSEEVISKKRLSSFFEKCRVSVEVYSAPEIERVKRRMASLRSIKFPYKEIRKGQSEMVRSVYRAIASSCMLLAEAPTGTGKTASVIFPALRALGEGKCEKVFYLTPKTTTATAAKECLELFSSNGALVRALIITAKDKICLGHHACRDGKALCDYSRLTKLPDAVMELFSLNVTVVTMGEIREIAKKYSVCPYELTLTYSEICDFIICDINYLFDPAVSIKRFFDGEGGEYVFLIDEAHNLPDRAREMYSAEISIDELCLPLYTPLISDESPLKIFLKDATATVSEILYSHIKEEIRENDKGERVGAVHLSEVPYQLYDLFSCIETILDEALLRAYSMRDEDKSDRIKFIKDYQSRIRKVNTALSLFDNRYEMFIFLEGDSLRFKLYCLDTGGVISSRISKGRSAVFFSATLTPTDYYRSLFGLDNSSKVLSVGSPFDPSQLSVCVIDKISTRYSEREDTLGAICRTIAATVSVKRGNYMIFSPSFAYSKRLAEAFSAKYPKIKVLVQSPDMTIKEKSEFLAEFEKESHSYLIGFCVLGGLYSEGVDLEGDKLIGAVVVGIGMPTLSYEREAISAYYDEKYEAGKQYAYIYPGMNRVLQAAGRVIRSESDRGVIVLIDDRFADPIYKKSAPDLWEGLKYIPNALTLKEELEAFWKRAEEEKKKESKNSPI